MSETNSMLCKGINKKPIFSIKNAFLFLGQIGILVGIISCMIIFVKIPVGNLNKLSPINIMSVQISISLLSITIMQLILPDRKERMFGVTYQNILFKWKVLKYFNALDCMMYMLILMIVNILLAVISVIATSSNIQYICKLCFLCAIIESFILAVYMIYLGLITKFKNSRIYYLLYKRINKRNAQSNEVYNMLLKGMKDNAFDATNIRSEYLNDEVIILEYMLFHMNEFILFNINENDACQLIKNEIENRKCASRHK